VAAAEAPRRRGLWIAAAAAGGLLACAIVVAGLIIFVVTWNSAWPEKSLTEDELPGRGKPAATPKRVHPRQKEIDQAIARGEDHLRKRLEKGGKLFGGSSRWPGEEDVGAAALAGLALLEAGISPQDASVQ
jgi:hypothetical protein